LATLTSQNRKSLPSHDTTQPSISAVRHNQSPSQPSQPPLKSSPDRVDVELSSVRFEAAKVEAPVKVGTDGKIVQPEPEKTFLQKYW